MNTKQERRANLFAAMAIIIWLTLAILICLALIKFIKDQDRFPYSKYQTNVGLDAEYHACKTESPEGFDCVAVFMMVSEEFIEEEYK